MDASESTVKNAGGPLPGSSTTTVGAFVTLSLSSFSQNRQLGITVRRALVVSLGASMFVLPNLLVPLAGFVGNGAVVSEVQVKSVVDRPRRKLLP